MTENGVAATIGAVWDGKNWVKADPIRRNQTAEEGPGTEPSGHLQHAQKVAKDTLFDEVNHPAHYTEQVPGVECIQVCETMSFCLGNAIKYIWRCNNKGNKKQDLEKAIWYLQREIKRCFPEDK